MDKEREIRLLLPPGFLYASLLIGIWQNPSKDIQITKLIPFLDKITSNGNDWGYIITALAGGGFLLLLTGYALGTLTGLSLRLLFLLENDYHHKQNYWGTYEAYQKEDVLKKALPFLAMKEDDFKISDDTAFYLGVTFDHEIFPDKLHKWMVRRWNGFNISANSAMGLLLSLVIGWCYSLFTPGWCFIIVLLSLALIISARLSWRSAMGMLEFQTKRASFSTNTCDKCPGNNLRLYVNNRP